MRTLWIVFFLIPFHVLAQENLSVNEKIERNYQEIRKQRHDVEQFITDFILRKVSIRMAQNLSMQGFDEAQIQQVLQGEAFAGLIEKIRSSKPLQQEISKWISSILEPGVLEEEVRKRRDALAQSIKEDLLRAKLEAKRSAGYREKESILLEKEKSRLETVLDQTFSDLMKGS
ncbi:MAG: hypothetical protein KDD52_03385 [Bdellovibrionales bacterium]|nr:hypothetical protein [Bdellovibrionales bacterium]